MNPEFWNIGTTALERQGGPPQFLRWPGGAPYEEAPPPLSFGSVIKDQIKPVEWESIAKQADQDRLTW